MTYTRYLNESYQGWIMNKISQELVTWAKEQGDIFLSYSDFYLTYFFYGITPNGHINKFPMNETYGLPKNLLLANLSTEIFINEKENSAIGILTYDNTYDQTDKNNFIDNLNDACSRIGNKYGKGKISVSMTGESALVKAMNEESRKDVERKDVLTIPLALCVLALIIRSWRLMFIPLLTFGVSICTSFSVMRPVKILYFYAILREIFVCPSSVILYLF